MMHGLGVKNYAQMVLDDSAKGTHGIYQSIMNMMLVSTWEYRWC